MSRKTPNPDKEFIGRVEQMLNDLNYLLPLSAAQAQYRESYGGMTSAALLEAVWYSALARFLRDHSGPSLTRAPKDQPGWDYQVVNKYSHKIGQRGPEAIAVIWDATKKESHWTAEHSIVFQAGNYFPRNVRTQSFGKPIGLRPLDGDANYLLKEGRTVIMAHWPPGETAEVLHQWVLEDDTQVQHHCNARELHELLRGSEVSANHIELFVTTRHLNEQEREDGVLAVGSRFQIDSGLRSGIYLITKAQMTNVPVSPNNRALLVDKKTVESRLRKAETGRRFVPMPTWWGAIARRTPPDLFAAQLADFNATVPLDM